MTTPFPFVAGSVLTASQLNNITNLPFNARTASYVLTAADNGYRVTMNVASANTVTVNNSIFAAADTVEIFNIGAGACTITAGAGVTLNGLSLVLSQYQAATIVFTSASNALVFPTGGAVKTTQVTAFTASGTFTPPTGVTYAIAYMKGGGGGIGRSSVGGAGGTSSVAFAGGTVSALGGPGVAVGHGSPDGTFGYSPQNNSGLGAYLSLDEQGLAGGNTGQAFEGAYIVAGGAVTPGVGISVTVGAGGTAGATSGFAGGSGYVYLEYAV